jgi:lysophospholipase L1-like esterase
MPYYTPPDPVANPIPVQYMDVFGHSFINLCVSTGVTTTSILTDITGEMQAILAASIGLDPDRIRNHGCTGSELTQDGRSQGGYARILTEITRKRQTHPFVANGGGLYLLCHGINDVGHHAVTATVTSAFKHAIRAFISRARASAIYPASGGANWTVGANFTAAPAANAEWTSGSSVHATVVDTAGTSTATFTIPIGYRGEPIVFAVVGNVGATGGILTLGGTITGTTGIIGTTIDTNNRGVSPSHSTIITRFTGPVNGLSAVNAGQTITLKVTTITTDVAIDSCWIESYSPCPVVVCNLPRLACRTYPWAFGDGVTTGATTAFTSATAAFTAADVGATITETDAQGAFTAGKTVASVTNATTIVLSAAAASAHTGIQFTLDRKVNGYTFYPENPNFSGATPASHAAADADIATFNALITTCVAEFDSMVQVADLDAAMGYGDTILPATVTSYYSIADGLHPNELGGMRCARAMYDAVAALRSPDTFDLGAIEVQSSPAPLAGSARRPRPPTQWYLPEFTAWAATYTAVAGDIFAMPIVVTESAENWGAAMVEQINAPVTSGSSIRWGIYDDPTWSGIPQCLLKEPTSGAAFALGTTAGVKNPASFSRNLHIGLYWLVLKIDALGTTASQLRAITGPNPYLPSWATAGTATTPIAWKLTGVTSGALPTTWNNTGATLANTAPALGVRTV